MAWLKNIARDVETGDPFLTGNAEIFGPDGALLASPAVNGTTGVWEYKVNGSPGITTQEYSAAGQTKKVDGAVGGQAGEWFELELVRILQLFGAGVITGMTVTAPGGMNVQVQTGDLLNLGGIPHCIHSAENVAIAAADPTNPRIDRIVSRLTRTGTFAGRLVLARVAGVPAASPVVPALTQDATTWEIEVARVTVPAAAASIVSGNISIVDRPIATGPLADGSVTTAKLADGAVTTAKIADLAVTLAKLAAEVEAALRGGPGLISTYWVSAWQVVGGLVRSGIGAAPASFAMSQNTLYGSLVHVPKATTLTGIGFLRTAAGSGLTTRLGLYKAGSNGLPNERLHDAGTLTHSSAGIKSVTGLSVALPAGWYWATLCAGSFGGSLDTQTIVHTGAEGRPVLGAPSIPTAASPDLLWVTQGVFSGTGALPATFPAPGLSNAGPLVWVQTNGS